MHRCTHKTYSNVIIKHVEHAKKKKTVLSLRYNYTVPRRMTDTHKMGTQQILYNNRKQSYEYN